jgi:hypothetical protein
MEGVVNVWDEICAERIRAHTKHADTSMESMGVFSADRVAILVEEVGEVAREMNEMRHHDRWRTEQLRKELVQVATMAVAWIAACDGEKLS